MDAKFRDPLAHNLIIISTLAQQFNSPGFESYSRSNDFVL